MGSMIRRYGQRVGLLQNWVSQNECVPQRVPHIVAEYKISSRGMAYGDAEAGYRISDMAIYSDAESMVYVSTEHRTGESYLPGVQFRLQRLLGTATRCVSPAQRILYMRADNGSDLDLPLLLLLLPCLLLLNEPLFFQPLPALLLLLLYPLLLLSLKPDR